MSNPERLLVTVRSRCVLVSCAGEEDTEDESSAALADEFVSLERKGDIPELTAWCFEHETLDAASLGAFLLALKRRYVGLLASAEDKMRIMDIIQLIDRCARYQTVNTGVKHILGLLAVRSAAETRKTID